MIFSRKLYRFSFAQRIFRSSSVLLMILIMRASAQTTITSIPADTATGISPSASIEFDFSGPMDNANTTATFFSSSPPGFYPVDSVWNNANDVLTCTPTTPFPPNTMISWVISGMDANNMQVFANGSFTTESGSGGPTGYGTNQITSFVAGKVYVYGQASTAQPVPTSLAPFIFSATTVLASNRTANSITLTLPNTAMSNLNQNIAAKENYYLSYFNNNSNTMEAAFPQGDYTFSVNATASNQAVVVILPAGMLQPAAPHLSNFPAAQAVDPTKAFTLSWDPFAGGTSSDYILVSVGNWNSAPYGASNALNGTTTSVTIPAGALVANSNYSASLGFERAVFSTNAAYASGAYRATVTEFTLKTVGGTGAPQPVLSNAGWSGNTFGFDVQTAPGQTITAVYTADCSLPLSQWQKLMTTNSTGASVHISDPNSAFMPNVYYSARNGP